MSASFERSRHFSAVGIVQKKDARHLAQRNPTSRVAPVKR